MVVVNDFFADEQLEYQTEIDSLGRFKITVPIMNSQLVYVDWKRLNKTMLLSPNDTIFLFADMPDLLPQPSDKSWDDFRLRDKQILCMGTNARVNNELLYYKALGLYVNSEEEVKKGISDMEYLRICENVYNQRMAHLEKYIADYPAVSEKFRFVQTNEENYIFASQLMQHRFDLKGKNFQEGYMDYVEKNILKFDPKVYTLVREYETFISDYIGYYSQNITIQSHISQFLEEAGLNTSENIKLLEDYDNFVNKLIAETDTLKQKKMIEENNKLMEKGNELFANPLIAKSREAYFRRALMDKYYHKADSLLQEPALKELWLTKRYVNDFEKNRIPWPNSDLQVIKTRITNPFLQSRLLEFNNDYLEIAKMDFVYPASFINTDDLEGEQNADTILKKIIAPYKGKVILMDFWGTWCGPCRRDMESSGDIKKAMLGKDLVFMYLANNSPESAWKNYLKKIQLTGEQIVHYRLPEQQQKLLEQKLDVHSFPTYFIIDREGNIRDSKLRFPLNFKNAVDELEKVL
jgi:thiol-disulfide isomerase/thioredoxin